jgi:DNA polymerase III delta subunit
VAYFWGEDAYGIGRAVSDAAALFGTPDQPLEVWRTSDDDPEAEAGIATTSAARRRERALGEIEQRLGTAPLFGGGTLVVVQQPAGLLIESGSRKRLLSMVATVPPGNGLVFADLIASGAKGPAAQGILRDEVESVGGLVKEFPVMTRDRMERWIAGRAAELGVTLGPGAAQTLAERVGAYVRESDADRRRTAELADQELQKLALYRPGGTVSREDVAELVPEQIPGSTWAFLDAVGARRGRDATTLAELLLAEAIPPPVLIGQLHRRIRDLIVVREYVDEGVRGGALARAMKVQPFRGQKLEEQAATWSAEELGRALEGLFELDLASKGISLDGSNRQMSDGRTALGLQQWIAEVVTRRR